MMDITVYAHAVFLGVIEGLTEFIPVSSTGHLILVTDLIGFQGPPGKVFEVVIQLGAIFAICWLYRQKLTKMVLNCGYDVTARRFVANLILAFLPAAVIGAMFHSVIKSVLFSPWVVSYSLIIGGLLILLIERKRPTVVCRNVDAMSPLAALAVGFFQTLAMIPGVSRSGATIMGGILLGIDRKAATEFSFFLAIPTMLGATVFDVYKNYEHLSVDNALLIAVGFISAFIAALVVVKNLIAFVGTHGFVPFAYYRIVVGTVMLALLYNQVG